MFYSLKIDMVMDGTPNVYNEKHMTLGAVFTLFRFILANRIAHNITGSIYAITEERLTIRKYTITESGNIESMVILRGVIE